MRKDELSVTIWRIMRRWVPRGNSPERCDMKADLVEEVGIDSVGLVQTILEIEKEFGITISDDELSGELLRRFSNLVNLVSKKIDETDRPS